MGEIMSSKSIEGSINLGEQIKSRRNELGLTIADAAQKAGVGIKTWCRYESGESIRSDKSKGVCKALNWKSLPNEEYFNDRLIQTERFKSDRIWSSYIEEEFGEDAAFAFSCGCELLEDDIDRDMNELAKMPKNSHVGQIDFSFLADYMPPQFLTQYDYEFLYYMKYRLHLLMGQAFKGDYFITDSVIEELLVFMIIEEAEIIMEEYGIDKDSYTEWIYDLFDDMDIVTFLYSDIYLPKDHIYHFSNWRKNNLK